MAVTIPFTTILRPYSTGYRGSALIHASTVMTRADWYTATQYAADRHIELPEAGTLPRGGVVGITRIVGCRRIGPGRWVFDLDGTAPVPFARASGDFEVFELQGGRACCMGCNTETRGAWRFCRSCGFPLGEATDSAPAAAGGPAAFVGG